MAPRTWSLLVVELWHPRWVEGVTAVLASQLAGAIVRRGASLVGRATLGSREKGALTSVARRAAATAASGFPRIASIGADIDLLSDDGVADELLRASVPGSTTSWTASRERWRLLYGGDLDSEGEAFLRALADEMRPRLQASAPLQGIWTAIAVERQAFAIEQQGDRLNDLIQSVEGLWDPLIAIQKRQGDIGSDFGYAMSVANALASALASGAAGKAVDLRLTGETGSVELLERPGVDVRVSFKKLVPNTDEGKAELAAIDEALKSGRPRDLGDVVDVVMTVDGEPVSIHETGKVVVGRATRRLKVLIDLEADGTPPVRLLFTGDSYVEDGRLYFTATESNRGAIRVALTIDVAPGPERHTTAKFRVAEDAPFTLAHQVVFQRTLACMGRGARITVDFIDPPLTRGTALAEPVPDLSDAYEVAEAFTKVDELQRLLGLDLPAIDTLSGEDYAFVLWGIELVKNGEAKVAASGEFSLEGDQEMADQLVRDAKATGRLSVRARYEQYGIDFGGGVAMELGPVEHAIHDAVLVGPTESDDGVCNATITYSAENEQVMRRVVDKEQ